MTSLLLTFGQPAVERCTSSACRPAHTRASRACRTSRAPARYTACCAAEPDRDPGDPAPADRPSSDAETSTIPDTLPVAGVDTDWREFRARLVAGSQKDSATPSGLREEGSDEAGSSSQEDQRPRHWAHTIPRPEKGCILIAHPLMFVQQQTYFSQAVIFLFSHDENGSTGLILNRSTNLKLGKVSGADPMCPEFANCELFLGGDVGTSTVHMLHGSGGLSGSKQIVQGVHLGGFEAAKAAVSEGRLDTSSVRWFARYCGWGVGQLQQECSNGVWFCAAAGPSLILDPGPNNKGPELWHTALELMGGQFADLSTALKTTYTGYRSDVMGHDKKSSETAPEQTSSSSDPPPETDKQEDQK